MSFAAKLGIIVRIDLDYAAGWLDGSGSAVVTMELCLHRSRKMTRAASGRGVVCAPKGRFISASDIGFVPKRARAQKPVLEN